MARVDRANRRVRTVVECDEARVLRVWIGGFVQHVVSRDPLVLAVVRGDLFPDPHERVLEVLVTPEAREVRASVGVPATALPAGCGVHIDDGVDANFRTDINGTVEVLECILAQDARIHVIWASKSELSNNAVLYFDETYLENDDN